MIQKCPQCGRILSIATVEVERAICPDCEAPRPPLPKEPPPASESPDAE